MDRAFYRIMLTVIVLGCLNLPTWANRSAQYEIKLGRQISAIILGKYTQSNDLSMIRYVNLVGQSIVSTSGRKDIRYHFTILESETPNAIACPGGYVFITTGLLNKLNSESELAGVLAHEIAHINQKHILNKLSGGEEANQNILLSLFGTKNTLMNVAFGELSNNVLTMIFEKGLDEQDEYEADIAAILYLQNTGYYSQSYLDMIARLHDTEYRHSETHPPIKKRQLAIRSIYPKQSLTTGVQLKRRFKVQQGS